MLATNQMLTQLEAGGPAGPDGILVTFGYVAPPVIITSPESPEDAGTLFNALGALPVRTLGRFSMSPQRASELIQVLQTALMQYEQAMQEVRGDMA